MAVRIILPISRQKIGPAGMAMLVERHLEQPYAVGEIVSDEGTSYEIVGLDGMPDPHHVSLLVKRVEA